MAYDYYCTECGYKNNESTVLFNMDALLTQSKTKELNLIHLRMTQDELRNLINSGIPNDGYRDCTLTFGQLMEYLSAPHSMNMEELRGLTLDDVREFTQLIDSGSVLDSSNSQNALFGGRLYGMDIENIGETNEDEVKKEWAPAIRKILDSSKKNMDKAFDENFLRNDLQAIYNLFSEDDNMYHFSLQPHTIYDDKTNPVLDGYWINKVSVDNSRICCRCHEHLFTKAGTAEHRVISFIGETSAGKTSTILSLTHYGLYGLCPLGDSESERVWKQNGVVAVSRQFSNIVPELLSNDNDKLHDDLEWFTYGVAPAKTEANKREDAYHSTMLVSNGNDGKKMILTLMDLPGELFNNGKVDEEKVCNEFSAALSSSAYVICFDTTKEVTQKDIIHLIGNAQKMQDLRLKKMGVKYYVPSMILFSKADGASSQLLIEDGPRTQLYMLCGENDVMKSSTIYTQVETQFKSDPMLRASYYAIMRCGAFGYDGPTTDDIMKGLGINKDLFGNQRDESIAQTDKKKMVETYNANLTKEVRPEAVMPKPSQIDLLMQWILHVSGCLPISQNYRTRNVEWSLTNYYVDRIQYRAVNPGRPSVDDDDIKEGMIRQILFRNPGKWDKLIVEALSVTGGPRWFRPEGMISGSKANIRKKMGVKPDSNAQGV